MAKQKCTFPGRNCPSCPYHETVGVTRYCSGFPKKRKARRFRKSDPKYKPPKWCPRRISPPVCRVYGFKDQESELSAWLLNQDMTSGKGIGQKVSPTVLAYHYKLRLELPLAMTAKQFYEAMQFEADTCVADEVRNQVEYGEVIDDGLKPYYFYFTSFRVIPLPYFDRSRVQPTESAPSAEGGERE